MAIRGVLWDLDGVLADTGEAHYQAWIRTLEPWNISYPHELFLKTFGMNNWSILTILCGHELEQELFQRISEQKEANFRQVIHGQVRLLPRVLETLQFLQARGIRQAIASSAPQENIGAIVDELGLREHFQAILSGYGMAGKPAPDVFLAAAKAIGVPPSQCLVIEDGIPGVEAAKRAGMTCLAVTNTNPAEALRGADYVVDSLLEVDAACWEKLLGVILKVTMEHEEKLHFILIDHARRYPGWEMTDLYKLLHQAAKGAEHAIRDEAGARLWLSEELADLPPGPAEPLIDPISPDGRIVRVHLRPLAALYLSLEPLLQAFLHTANAISPSLASLSEYAIVAIQLAREGLLLFQPDQLNDFFAAMQEAGFPAAHHSERYKRLYRPAYRVVAHELLPEEMDWQNPAG